MDRGKMSEAKLQSLLLEGGYVRMLVFWFELGLSSSLRVHPQKTDRRIGRVERLARIGS